MEVRWHFLWMLLGASAVTLLPRVLPFLLLSRVQLPEWGQRWLKHIPIAIMSALLTQELLISDGSMVPSWPKLMAAIPAFLVAYVSRSLLGTVITGIIAMMFIRLVF